MTTLTCNSCEHMYSSSEIKAWTDKTKIWLKVGHNCPKCGHLNQTLFQNGDRK